MGGAGAGQLVAALDCVRSDGGCGRSVGGKDASKPVGAGLARDLGDRGPREERIEAVESAGPDVQLGLASGRPDSRRIGNGLVSETSAEPASM